MSSSRSLYPASAERARCISDQGPFPTKASSASQAIEVVIGLHARRGSRIALIEPAFDFIRDLMAEQQMTVVPIAEAWLADPDRLALVTRDVDSLFIIAPNNPTGRGLSSEEFSRLCQFCEHRSLSLIVDASFRWSDERACYNYYALLEASGVEYCTIEDTGKIWAKDDVKAAFIVCASSLITEARRAFHNRLLCISAFNLALLWQLAELGQQRGLRPIRQLLAQNRALVRTELATTRLAHHNQSDSRIPVEQVFYDPHRWPDQARLLRELYAQGIGVTGSEPYYWSSSHHQPFLRLAINRDPNHLAEGLQLLRQVLR